MEEAEERVEKFRNSSALTRKESRTSSSTKLPTLTRPTTSPKSILGYLVTTPSSFTEKLSESLGENPFTEATFEFSDSATETNENEMPTLHITQDVTPQRENSHERLLGSSQSVQNSPRPSFEPHEPRQLSSQQPQSVPNWMPSYSANPYGFLPYLPYPGPYSAHYLPQHQNYQRAPFDITALAQQVARQIASLTTTTMSTTTVTATTTATTPITTTVVPLNLDLLYSAEETGGVFDIASLLSGGQGDIYTENEEHYSHSEGGTSVDDNHLDLDLDFEDLDSSSATSAVTEEEPFSDYDYSNYVFQPDPEPIVLEGFGEAEVKSEDDGKEDKENVTKVSPKVH